MPPSWMMRPASRVGVVQLLGGVEGQLGGDGVLHRSLDELGAEPVLVVGEPLAGVGRVEQSSAARRRPSRRSRVLWFPSFPPSCRRAGPAAVPARLESICPRVARAKPGRPARRRSRIPGEGALDRLLEVGVELRSSLLRRVTMSIAFPFCPTGGRCSRGCSRPLSSRGPSRAPPRTAGPPPRSCRGGGGSLP